MSVRSTVVVVLALVCGLSAAVGMSQLRRGQQGAPEKIETVELVVAKRHVPRGQMLTAEMLQTRAWPKEVPLEGALSKIEEGVDRATLVPLVAGEPLLDGKLASRESGRGLAALVPRGMRAYTIHTAKAASNVAGFILPGNRVDVLLSLKSNQNDETGGGSATTLLQAVEILAVDQRLDAPAENKVDPNSLGSVTLLVTPKQASLLDLGQSSGTLTLSLRNPEDTQPAVTEPATLASIRFRQEKPAAVLEPASAETRLAPVPLPAAKPERQTVEIRTMRAQYTGQVLVQIAQ